LVSFGGPEKPDDVLPFLENVLRGKNIPRERLEEVVEHYDLFDGQSPLNAQNRALLVALVGELNARGPQLPVYWGNRNWHPLLADTLEQMADDGVCRALAFVTSAFGSYSGCRQYLEDIEQARQAIGPQAPQVDKLRLFYNHPGLIEPMADRLVAALEQISPERRDTAQVIFTAHSLPEAMARTCPYQAQLSEACQLVAERAGRTAWQLAYQSRSGPPNQPWLAPDIKDLIRQLHATHSIDDLVVAPIGFLSEHMEVVYDLDVEVAELCQSLGINFVRAAVVNTHPRFVQMIRELVLERIDPATPRLALGSHGPSPDNCPAGCCLARRGG
jgi:ferrochelatase